ncbi:MAG: nucleoside hydrolase [Chloroflexota bacterium]
MPKRVIFDTDPGVDDAMAMLFMIASPEIELEAVTTVFGNNGAEQTTRNAIVVLDIAGRAEIPVARGAERPLIKGRKIGSSVVHGENGLGDAPLPTPSRGPVSQRAAELIIERIMAAPRQITLIAVGPLTNIALATRLEPLIADNVRELIIMGGAIDAPGNLTPLAEANIGNDPEAAWIVFHAGFPLTMLGLNVTHRTVMTPDYVAGLRRDGGAKGAFIADISAHYADVYRKRNGAPGFPVHDSSAVLYAIDPGYFTTEQMFVDVEIKSARGYGQTMPDRRGQWDREPNVNVCVDVDSARFLDLYRRRITGAH